jgi:hypothetical protein
MGVIELDRSCKDKEIFGFNAFHRRECWLGGLVHPRVDWKGRMGWCCCQWKVLSLLALLNGKHSIGLRAVYLALRLSTL